MVNKKYSYQDFMDQTFTDRKAGEFNDTEIVGSCFYQQGVPNCKVFPDTMKGVTFKRCNLDNVYIPPGNTVITAGEDMCCHRNIQIQNDLEDWVLDTSLKPVEPIDKAKFHELKLSTDPKDIPVKKIDVSVTQQKEKQLGDAINAKREAL